MPINEKHPFQGQSPYSAMKIGVDRMAEAFIRSFNLPATIVRPFNTYGPRQSARAIIPTIIAQLLSGETEIMLGNLLPTRDFNYVKDTVAGFIEVAKSNLTIGEDINIASQKEISMKEIFEEIKKQINPDAVAITDHIRMGSLNSEVDRLLGSNEKIRTLTGWEPKYNLEAGLKETISWMRNKISRYKAGIYNI